MDKLSELKPGDKIRKRVLTSKVLNNLSGEGLWEIAQEVAQLEAENKELWKLDKAVGEAFKDYPYENESGIKKMTLQSFAVIQRIRKALEAGGE